MGGGARLDPDSIAMPTLQFFAVASPPDRQTGFGVGQHRISGTGRALHTGLVAHCRVPELGYGL